MKPREHLGLLIASVLLVAVLCGFLRVRPARSEMAEMERRTQEAEARLAAMPVPGEPMGDPGTLETKVRQIEEEIARAQTRLDALEKGRVALDDPTALYRLQVETMEWARQCGMHIMETSEPPVVPSDPRPRFRLRAETSYFGFLKFIRGFQERSGSVTLVEYVIEPPKETKDVDDENTLEATMTLMF